MSKLSKGCAKSMIISLIIVLIIALCIPISAWLYFDYTNTWKLSANYTDYADDFNNVKNYVVAEFPNETSKWLYVSRADGKGIQLFDPDTKEYLQAPGDVLSSIETITHKGFSHKDATFDAIRIQEDQISFEVESRWYALVYSPNQKPSCIATPKENYKTKVKSIGDGWYHVVEKLK